MAEKDKNGEYIGEIAQHLLKTMNERRDVLLLDMNPGYPAIRKFLLGCEIGGRVYPAGSIRIETDSAECIVQLAIPMLGVSYTYRDTSADGLLERIENDLDTETVPWQHNWEVKKKQKERGRRAIGLA